MKGTHSIIVQVPALQTIGRQERSVEEDDVNHTHRFSPGGYLTRQELCTQHQVGAQDSPGRNMSPCAKEPESFLMASGKSGTAETPDV